LLCVASTGSLAAVLPEFAMPVFARVALPLLLLLSACATHPTNNVQGGQNPLDESAITALYARVDAAAEAYRAALQQLAGDDPAQGNAGVAGATAQLRDAVSRCVAASGCDVTRVVSVYDALLQERAQALDAQSESFVALPADEITAGEGLAQEQSPLVADVPESGRSVALLNGRNLSEIIAMKGPVKASLNEWLTWMRPNLISAWENYQYMRYLMWPEYEKAGLPEALLFGILAKESGGRVHAVSRAGASGPLQFMYSTGLRYGLGQVNGFDTRFDPQLSARANVSYLNDRFAELNHNLEMALAAYNGGEGRVGRLYRSSGGKDFWSSGVYGNLPPETRDYVPMVLAAAWLFMHPEQYGLEFPEVDARPSTLVLQHAGSINELAICLGNAGNRDGWFRPLRNLNPRFEAHTMIAEGTELRVPAVVVPLYRDRCLNDAIAAQAKDIASANRVQASKARLAAYTVRSGDTLAGIARKHGCGNPRSLAQGNAIRGPQYLIRPGQKLSLAMCRGP
jgi:membrane-bound lytic murein transglycosylase D